MTKQEYITELQDKLKSFDADLVAEIVDDCEAHFRAGKENGKTEEEICEELGSTDEIVEELSQLYGKKTEKDFQSAVNHVVNDAINIANNIAGSLVKEIKSGIDYGKKTWNERTSSSSETESTDKETKSGTLKKIVLDGNCGDVIVSRSSDEFFHIEYINGGSIKTKMMFQFHGEEKGDCYYGYLSKKEGVNSLFQILTLAQIKIKLLIPEDIVLLEIKTTSGDVRMDYAQVDELIVSSLSGDLAAANINVQSCLLKSASGDISLDKGNGMNLKVRSGSGDCSIHNSHFQHALYKLESGDLTGKHNTITNFVSKIRSGDFSLEDITADSCSVTQMSGDTELINSRIEKLDLNTISGDIEVDLLQEVNANIQSISGEISIQIPDGEEGYRTQVSTVSGEAFLNFQGEERYRTQMGEYTLGEGKSNLIVSSVSGDISIRNERRV